MNKEDLTNERIQLSNVMKEEGNKVMLSETRKCLDDVIRDARKCGLNAWDEPYLSYVKRLLKIMQPLL